MVKKLLLALAVGTAAVPSARAQGGAAATLVSAAGSVTVTAGNAATKAAPPMALADGAKITTGADGSALVLFASGSKMQLAGNSVFLYQAETKADTTVQLLQGLLTGWIKNLNGRRLNIRMPTSVASVRGTVLTCATDGKRSRVDLFSGSVRLTDRFGRQNEMSSRQRATITLERGIISTGSLPPNARAPAEPPAAGPAPAEKPKAADKKKAAAAPPPSTESPASPPALQPVAPPSPEQQQSVANPVSPSAP